MAETASVSPVGPRYAPEDPTLPKPWKGLVDGTTGYLYFWNPDTNITQYERPKASSGRGPSPAPTRSTLASISSSVHIHHSTQGHLRSSRNDEDIRHNGDNGRPKLAAIPVGKNHQVDKFLVLASRSTSSAYALCIYGGVGKPALFKLIH